MTSFLWILIATLCTIIFIIGLGTITAFIVWLYLTKTQKKKTDD